MLAQQSMAGRRLLSRAAILGPSGGRPWLLGGSEDPWLSVPVFRRVWLCRCYRLIIVEDCADWLTVNLILGLRVASDDRFGSLAAPQDSTISTAAFGSKAAITQLANPPQSRQYFFLVFVGVDTADSAEFFHNLFPRTVKPFLDDSACFECRARLCKFGGQCLRQVH